MKCVRRKLNLSKLCSKRLSCESGHDCIMYMIMRSMHKSCMMPQKRTLWDAGEGGGSRVSNNPMLPGLPGNPDRGAGEFDYLCQQPKLAGSPVITRAGRDPLVRALQGLAVWDCNQQVLMYAEVQQSLHNFSEPTASQGLENF